MSKASGWEAGTGPSFCCPPRHCSPGSERLTLRKGVGGKKYSVPVQNWVLYTKGPPVCSWSALGDILSLDLKIPSFVPEMPLPLPSHSQYGSGSGVRGGGCCSPAVLFSLASCSTLSVSALHPRKEEVATQGAGTTAQVQSAHWGHALSRPG